MWTTKKILDIQALIDRTCLQVKRDAAAIYSKELVELLFIQPYARISNVAERGIASRETASKYLKHLTTLGFLEEVKVGRDKLFLNRRFLELLKTQ